MTCEAWMILAGIGYLLGGSFFADMMVNMDKEAELRRAYEQKHWSPRYKRTVASYVMAMVLWLPIVALVAVEDFWKWARR